MTTLSSFRRALPLLLLASWSAGAAAREPAADRTSRRVAETAEPCLVVRSAPSIQGLERACPPPGTPLEVLETVGGWSRVALPDGVAGWVESDGVDGPGEFDNRLSGLHAEIRAIAPAIAALQRRLAASEEARQKLEAETAAHRAEADRLRRELEESRAEITELRQELEETREGGQAVERRHSEQLAEVERKLMLAQDSLVAADAARTLESERAEALAAENESLRAFIELVREKTRLEEAERGAAAATEAEPGTEPEPAPATATPAAVIAPTEPPAATEAAEAGVVSPAADDVGPLLVAAVESWARAWSEQRVEDYLGHYAASFEPENALTRQAWEAARRRRISGPEWIEVKVAVRDVRIDGADRAEIEVLQSYASDGFSDVVVKTLELGKTAGGWKIVRERVN